MAKKKDWGTAARPGHSSAADFEYLVSPLGTDGAETPRYSPSRAVNSARAQRRGEISLLDKRQGPGDPASITESRRNDLREGD